MSANGMEEEVRATFDLPVTPRQLNPLADALGSRRNALAQALVDRQYALQPGLALRFGDAGRQRCLEDAKFHLEVLTQSVRAECPELFLDYIAWAKVMLERRGIPMDDLSHHLALLRDLLRDEIGALIAQPAVRTIDSSISALPFTPEEPAGFLDEQAPLAAFAREYLELVQGGERRLAVQRLLSAAAGGVPVPEIYMEVLQRCQREIGLRMTSDLMELADGHASDAVQAVPLARRLRGMDP